MGDKFESRSIQNEREEFLEQIRQERVKRAEESKKKEAIVIIQCATRRFLAKRKLRKLYIERFLKKIDGFDPNDRSTQTLLAADVYQTSYQIIKKYDKCKDKFLLEKLCRYVNWSLNQTNPSYSYVSCSFPKGEIFRWIDHIKCLTISCIDTITELCPDIQNDSKLISIFLITIISLTSTKGWSLIQQKQFAHLEIGLSKVANNVYTNLINNGGMYKNFGLLLLNCFKRPGRFALSKVNLQALNVLTIKPLTFDKPELLESFSRYILTVPGYIFHFESLIPDPLDFSYLPLIAGFLLQNQNLDKVIVGLNVCYILSLAANLIHLIKYSRKNDEFKASFMKIFIKILKEIEEKNSLPRNCHWHSLLGWVPDVIPDCFINSTEAVKKQMEYLWGPVLIDVQFYDLFCYLEEHNKNEKFILYHNCFEDNNKQKGASIKNAISKAVKKALFIPPVQLKDQDLPITKFYCALTNDVSIICQLYNKILKVFSFCKLDILTGLCFNSSSKLLSALFHLVIRMRNEMGNKGWAEAIQIKTLAPQEAILNLFSDGMIHYITVLDDQEMYEDQTVFTLDDLAIIADFVNQLCFRLISQHMEPKETTWQSLKTLLLVLYRRDCRRKFCPVDHWLTDQSKMNQMIHDIEKGKKNAKKILQDMPHVLREDARVILFRKWASSEKTLNSYAPRDDYPSSSSSSSTLITIQRGRIVEDGYAQLANLSIKSLKGTIRVRFQNEHGLDEAGIDQDGVFKEFLEETINCVFNPSLNLFKCTSENLLYPSPISYLHENHLELFEFVGKILAKAIYEGIVVDVHFAPFFLSQILGHQHNALFSAIDELRSLDLQLYNSLNCIKHYAGDVREMELTFSIDQDILGAIKTTELVPGGRAVTVTNENKINYLYLMAHFHLYLQIKEQTAAFLKGFRTIIPSEWLKIFSPGELQRLISGEDSDIDLVDLRRNTQYYGGFHDNHKVVSWLWEILENDFNEEERRLFLKFVTSCSKPPLLGFVNLDPPFSIRCVEVSDDEDTGDTIGSVLRGFLAIGKKDPVGRLPTSSTCFNLLKLPNYQKKSTLCAKLRYAITSNVGFELS